jgi:hypothetical protein
MVGVDVLRDTLDMKSDFILLQNKLALAFKSLKLVDVLENEKDSQICRVVAHFVAIASRQLIPTIAVLVNNLPTRGSAMDLDCV